MGRNKRTKLDVVRAKVWAHTCAWEAGADKEKKASTHLLARLANDFRQSNGKDKLLDTGFWSRCLHGKKGVSTRLVAEFGNEKLWPLSFSAYHFGPPIPCGPTGEGYYECTPLWAILRNQPKHLPNLWGKIRTHCWVDWSPFMAEYSSDGQPIDTWLGPVSSNFKSQLFLYKFFDEYMKNLECLEPLFGLAVALSWRQLQEYSCILLPSYFSSEYLKRMEDGLAIFNIGLNDLADVALEHGFILQLEEPENEVPPSIRRIRPLSPSR